MRVSLKSMSAGYPECTARKEAGAAHQHARPSPAFLDRAWTA